MREPKREMREGKRRGRGRKGVREK